MYMCVINNWVVWNMESMCNCKEITLITHEITSSQNSIIEPEKPLTKAKKEIPPVTVKWGVLFMCACVCAYIQIHTQKHTHRDKRLSKAICIQVKFIILKKKMWGRSQPELPRHQRNKVSCKQPLKQSSTLFHTFFFCQKRICSFLKRKLCGVFEVSML